MAKEETVVSNAKLTTPPGLSEHQKMCDRLFKMNPEERATEDMVYFSMLYFSLVGKKPSEEENKEAKALMVDFFKINDIPIPDPGLFIPMIKLVAKNGLDIYQKELHHVATQTYLTTRDRIPSWKYVKKLI